MNAIGIHFDYIAVVEIRPATDSEEGETINVHVNYEVVAEGQEAAALELLHELEAQAADPTSALLNGVVTNTITASGDDPNELALHNCEPVFLGPDIGFVSVMEFHDDDGSCHINMGELASVCAAFFAECMAFLESGDTDEPEPEPEADSSGCSNLYDSTHGDGQCAALIEGGYGCETHFCAECMYATFCDQSCSTCSDGSDGSSLPEVSCPEGHRSDCRGLCVVDAWVGDGFCDDPYEGHHLNCEELEFDGGDCEGDPAEFVVDCLDQRAPTSWHGDGTCDNGIYAHNGRWINLNCASTGWDGGDCEHSPLNHMQCIRLIRSLDSCEATGDDGYRCESDECVQAIESLASGWDECVDLLGITQNILEQFQAVCGNCSPMPIFEACGLGVSFPDSRSPCNTEHCADTMVPWYTDDFTACEAEVVTMGASEQDLANLQLFYARCAQTQGR